MRSIFRVANHLRQAVASTSRLPAAAAAAATTTTNTTNPVTTITTRQLHGLTSRHTHASPGDYRPGSPAAAAAALLPSPKPSKRMRALQLQRAEEKLRKIRKKAQLATQVYTKLKHLHPSTKHSPQVVPLSTYVFGLTPRRDVIHSAIVYHLDGLRAGTGSTKTRGEVNYSGRKLRPQKGTGKSRMGSRGSPLLRGGGVSHGPKPRNFATKLPRRVRELALRSALSARWMEGRMHVIPSFHWNPPPRITGPLRNALQSRGWEDALFLSAPRSPASASEVVKRRRDGRPSALDPIYTPEQIKAHIDEIQNFAIGLANVPKTKLVLLNTLTEHAHLKARTPEAKKAPGELPTYEVIKRQNLVLDLGAVEWLEEKLGGSIFHPKEEEGEGEGESEGEEGEEGSVDLLSLEPTEEEQKSHPTLDALQEMTREDEREVEGAQEVLRDVSTPTLDEQRK